MTKVENVWLFKKTIVKNVINNAKTRLRAMKYKYEILTELYKYIFNYWKPKKNIYVWNFQTKL